MPCELRVEVGDEDRRYQAGEAFKAEWDWLDPSTLANRLVHQIDRDQNFGDILESITPLVFDNEDLDTASYLVGRRYTSIEAFEITDYADFDRVPYFRVTSGGVSYGSEGMGRGELALLLMYWTLKDLSKQAILILEEPETHVSPRSQEGLMDVIAKFVDEKRFWVLIATHSPTVIQRIPDSCITHLVRSNGPSNQVITRRGDIALLLGSGIGYSGVLLVEDEFAKSFVIAILEEEWPDLLRRCEIIACGSASGISSVLDAFPRTRPWLTIVGVYDGDQREELGERRFTWPHVFLPGALGPERIILAPISDAGYTEKLAELVGVDVEAARFAMSFAEGADVHEYCGCVAQGLNAEVSLVRRSVVRLWKRTPEGERECEAFIRALQEAAVS
jgi:hypothetical protein